MTDYQNKTDESTRLLPATAESLALAASLLRHGDLVEFPTETV